MRISLSVLAVLLLAVARPSAARLTRDGRRHDAPRRGDAVGRQQETSRSRRCIAVLGNAPLSGAQAAQASMCDTVYRANMMPNAGQGARRATHCFYRGDASKRTGPAGMRFFGLSNSGSPQNELVTCRNTVLCVWKGDLSVTAARSAYPALGEGLSLMARGQVISTLAPLWAEAVESARAAPGVAPLNPDDSPLRYPSTGMYMLAHALLAADNATEIHIYGFNFERSNRRRGKQVTDHPWDGEEALIAYVQRALPGVFFHPGPDAEGQALRDKLAHGPATASLRLRRPASEELRSRSAGGALTSATVGSEAAGVDWSAAGPVEESLGVCAAVRQAIVAGRAPPPGGRLPEPGRFSNTSRLFFYHVPKSAGSAFAVLLPMLMGSALPRLVVSSPEMAYPESRAAADALRAAMGARLELRERAGDAGRWPVGAHLATREMQHHGVVTSLRWAAEGRPALHELRRRWEAADSPGAPPVWGAAFLRRPDARLASQFHHDAMRGRVGRCVRSPEELLSRCAWAGADGFRRFSPLRPGCGDADEVCRPAYYSNTATKLLPPPSELSQLEFLGLTEHYPLSVCLFLATFRLDSLFDSHCRGAGGAPPLHASPALLAVVNSGAQQTEAGGERSARQAEFEALPDPARCASACQAANAEDYAMWRSGAELFWWRAHAMAAAEGVALSCDGH